LSACPWCGRELGKREPNHNYHYALSPKTYDGPRCEHGYPDVPCMELHDMDFESGLDLKLGIAIREFRAAALARRYGIAPTVIDWIRPCPHCRKARAGRHRAILDHELGEIAKALAAEEKAARRRVRDLSEDERMLHEAFFELQAQTKLPPEEYEASGFVYLIGHDRAVKIGWSSKHPSRGRLSQLRSASFEPLELLGLIEGTAARERELHKRFSVHRIGGEWFLPHEDILTYFNENSVEV
jgi:hypothetical protein